LNGFLMSTSSRTLTPEEAFLERAFPKMITLDITLAPDASGILNAMIVRLLDGINSTGTLTAAAKEAGVGFKKAVSLIKEVNRGFEHPLVVLTRGGMTRGGSALTDEGQVVLTSYRKAIEKALAAAMDELYPIARLLPPRTRNAASRFVVEREVSEIPNKRKLKS